MTQKTCTHPNCKRPLCAKGLCYAHYSRQLQGRPMDAPIRKHKTKPVQPCRAVGCVRPVNSHGLCFSHDLRRRRGRSDWNTPLRQWLPKSVTLKLVARVPRDVADALSAQAKAHGHTRAQWVRIVLRQQVAEALKAPAEDAAERADSRREASLLTLLASSDETCADCGKSHGREPRHAWMRKCLADGMSTSEMKEAWPCMYGMGDTRKDRRFYRDLEAVRQGAVLQDDRRSA